MVGGGQVAHRRVAGLLEARARVTVVCPGGHARPGGPGRARLADLGGPALRARRPGRRLVRRRGHRRPRGERRGRRGGRARAHLLRPRRRPVAVQRLDARGGPARRPGRRACTAAATRSAPSGCATPSSRGSPTAASPTAPPAPPHGARPGSVVLVGGGPGDPGLITVRGRQAVAQADVVVADHLAPLAAAGVAAARRRGHRRLEAAARPVDGPGADQRAAGRARAGRAGGSCGSRAATRSSSAAAWRSSRRAWPRACRSRSSRA